MLRRFIAVSILAFVLSASLMVWAGGKAIILATTTSTQATGLLDKLLPAFTKATGIEVKPIAVGTGKAFELAKSGNADVVMVHARKLEDAFVKDGFGVNAWDLMFNDFVIVGPKDDPAGLKASANPADAFKKLAESRKSFISRADKSGTYEREKELWAKAGASMTAPAYIEAGQGMAETLQMASEKAAYTLCDRATWLSMRAKVNLAVDYENPQELKNSYAVIAVDQKKVPQAKTKLANTFISWVTASEAQSIIGSYSIDGETLFHLSVGKR